MKKFLSLVLALVMTMSLVTVSAGAKDFTDDGEITYKEAVDVISAIGVVDGYSDGDFRPDDVLTRGAAAKIICNLILGPTTASALSADTAPFKDVPINNTFAGYITYCSQQKIINGYGDGTFRPTGTLSGNAFMKMLLGALGYDSSVEGYTGANWSVAVIKQAVGIGLDDGNDEFVGSKAVTRQEAALYAFNMLQATMVEYDAKTTVDVNGATVTVAGDKAKEVSNTASNETIDDDNKMQFAEKYFDKLTLNDDGSDPFSRPSNVWRFKGEKVGTYAKTPDVTYSKNVELGDIYKDLELSEKDTADVYVNGIEGDAVVVSKANEVKIASDNGNKGKVDTGSTVEVFYDEDNNDVTICVIDNYVGTVSKTVEAKGNADRYVVIANESDTSIPSYNNEYETAETFGDDTVVLFTYSELDKEIQTVVAAESVAGTMTRKEDNTTTGKKVTLADNAYPVAKNVGYDGFTFASMTVDSEYTAYLDQYGNAIYFVEEEFVPEDYALITAIEGNANDSNFASNRVKLLTGAGEIKTYDTDKNYTSVSNGAFKAGMIVTYKVDEDKEVKLSKTSTSGQTVGLGYFADDGDFIMENGKAAIQVNNTKNAVYANSKTVFVIYDGDDYKVYTGINNAPTVMSDDGSTQGTVGFTGYCKTNGMLTIAFIDASDAETFYNSKTVVFLAGDSKSDRVTTSDGTYYEYNAVVDGKIVDGVIKIDVNANYSVGVNDSGRTHSDTNYMFNGVNFDKYDIGTSFNSFATDDTAVYTGTVKLSGDYTIGFGTDDKNPDVRYTVAEDAKIFYVNDDGEISEATLNSIKTDKDDTAMMVLEDGQITYLFVQEVTEGVNDIPVDNKKGNVTTELNGSKADATYTVASNGTLRVSVDYTAPDFAVDNTTVTFDLEVYADGKYYGTINNFANGVALSNSTMRVAKADLGYPDDEALTFKIVNEKVGAVEAKYYDGTTDITAKMVADGSSASLVTAPSSATLDIKYASSDSGKAVKATVSGATVSGAAITEQTLSHGSGVYAAAVSTASATGKDYVKVNVTGLGSLVETYSITGEATDLVGTGSQSGALLTTFQGAVSGETAKLKLTVSKNTSISAGSSVTLKMALDTTSVAPAYDVTVKVNGQTFTGKTNGTTNVDLGVISNIQGDLKIMNADVTLVPVEKIAVTSASWDGASTVTLTFNRPVEATSGETASNYTWAAGGQSNTPAISTAKVTGDNKNVVVLTFINDVLKAGNTITLTTNIKDADYSSVVTTAQVITLKDGNTCDVTARS